MASLRTVAVTGASGMVGRHVVAALAADRIGCLPVGRAQWNLSQWLHDATLDALFGAADAVVHAAAAVPSPGSPVAAQDILDANMRATFCLGDWARRRGKPLVFLSGATVYASVDKAGIAETDPVTSRPASGLYGLSKLLAEQLLDSLAAQGLRLCTLRASSVYGAGMRETRMVAQMLATARRNEAIRVQPPARDRINLVHGADLAAAVVAALKREAWDVFNVAGADAVSVADIARACVEAAGSGQVVMPADDGSPGGAKYQLDCRKAAAVFGYAPRVALGEGLRRMLARTC